MNCFHHEDRVAVAQCRECGVGLCKECTSRYSVPTCQRCAEDIVQYMEAEKENELEIVRKRVKRSKKIFITMLIVCILIFFCAIPAFGEANRALGISLAVFVAPMFAYVFAAFPYGWKKANDVLSHFKFILILPIAGWIMYFFAKIFIAAVIGEFYFPFAYSKDLKTLKNADK